MRLRIQDFNPFSNQGAISHFKKDVSSGNKLKIRIATFFAALITLPLLGIGGVAVFRALTRKYSVMKLDASVRQTNDSVSPVSSPIKKSAQKTQNQYIRAAEHFFQTKGKQLIDAIDYSSLITESDTFFKITSESLGLPQKQLLQEMRIFIEKNPEKVKQMFEKIKFKNLNLKDFKDFLLNEDISKTLVKQHGADKLMNGIALQKWVNQTRCDLLSQMHDVKIVLHDIVINHSEDFVFDHPLGEAVVSTDNKSMFTTEYDPKVFGEGKSKIIELVLGDILHSKFFPEITGDQIFIQPRKLEDKANPASATTHVQVILDPMKNSE